MYIKKYSESDIARFHEKHAERKGYIDKRKELEDAIISVIGKDNWRAFNDGVSMMGYLSIISDIVNDFIDSDIDVDESTMALMSGSYLNYADIVTKVLAAYPELAQKTNANALTMYIESIKCWLDKSNLELIGGEDSLEYRNWCEYCNYGTKAMLLKVQMNGLYGRGG